MKFMTCATSKLGLNHASPKLMESILHHIKARCVDI